MTEPNQNPIVAAWSSDGIDGPYHNVGAHIARGTLRDPLWYLFRDGCPHPEIWLVDTNGTKFRAARKHAKEAAQ